jgi:hypothetical protein
MHLTLACTLGIERKIMTLKLIKTIDLLGENKKNKERLSIMRRAMKLVAFCIKLEGIRVSNKEGLQT